MFTDLLSFSQDANSGIERRHFLKYAGFATFGLILPAGCKGHDPSPTPEPNPSQNQTLAFIGDSLTAGAGGTAYGTYVGNKLSGREIAIYAIGGQNSAQIAARQGGLPITMTLEGNAFRGADPVKISKINVQFLSSIANPGLYTSKGTIAGMKATVGRISIDNAENYTITPDVASTMAVPADSQFIPDEAARLKSATQILWLGRNYTGSNFIQDTTAHIEQCIGYISDPKRYIVLGLLTAIMDVNGTPSFIVANNLNDHLKAAYENHFVEMTPPTAAELTAINYVPTEQDKAEIENGVFPMSLRFDALHLNNSGYQIIANRVTNKILELKY